VIVVDASVLAPALADDGPDGEAARRRLWDEEIAAPEIVDLEVASVWRRAVRAGHLGKRRAEQAIADLGALPLARASHRPLMPRVWQLQANLSPYDAAYVALAEALGAPLLTADARLGRSPSLRCAVEVLA
jgi:predicted nucleic acid-binding protein